jgi:poly-gamma-glutamate synthesis protein (capsule biosynthesis protein)
MMANQFGSIGICLCGDVMTGRGVDQVLPHPGNPMLHEIYIHDARQYVQLAELRNGPLVSPVDPGSLWGDALNELRRPGIDARIVNLETSITCSGDTWPAKGIHYRMNPENIDCLTVAGIDCCSLANNHMLDWGYEGLAETLRCLDRADIDRSGAGECLVEATRPATIEVAGKGRVLVFSLGSATSGIPREWGATEDRPGVNLLEDLSTKSARHVAAAIDALKRPGDVTLASIHWGSNWGFEIPREQIRFAHTLVDGGVDIVHGHSSHHVKGIEVYHGHLILYGSGDLIDDYEGISGHESYRSDVRLLYIAHADSVHGRLEALRLVPMRIERFRLHSASSADQDGAEKLLNRLGSQFDTQVRPERDGSLTLLWR